MTAQPEPVKFPLPPYGTGSEVRTLAAECPVAKVELPVTWENA